MCKERQIDRTCSGETTMVVVSECLEESILFPDERNWLDPHDSWFCICIYVLSLCMYACVCMYVQWRIAGTCSITVYYIGTCCPPGIWMLHSSETVERDDLSQSHFYFATVLLNGAACATQIQTKEIGARADRAVYCTRWNQMTRGRVALRFQFFFLFFLLLFVTCLNCRI